MTIEVVWDDRLRGFKYKLPSRAGFVTPDVKRTSVISSNAAIAREVKEVAFAIGVKLPAQFELSVTR